MRLRSTQPVPAVAIIAMAGAAIVIGIYLLRLNQAAGLMVDDAWYLLLAKSLAEGTGYRLISSATTPILPNYPPGFPAILSLVFRAIPDFPQNVWLLKSVSIAAMMGVGGLTYLYLHRQRRVQRDLASLAAVAVMITPAFVFLATSTVMSECMFTFGQLATIFFVHRSVNGGTARARQGFTLAAAVLAAATILVRSAAIGLLVASVLWLLKERLWKRAALFAAVAILCLMPWALYARAHTPTAEERAAHGGAVVYSYADQFWMRWAGTPELGRITARDLPERILTNLVDVFGRDVGGILVPTLFRGSSESGEEVLALGGTAGLSAASMGGAVETVIISFILSGVALIGFVQVSRERVTVAELYVPIALAIVLVWPFWSYRFVLPLAPFLFLYFVRGLQALATPATRVALLCIIGLNLVDHAGYIRHAGDSTQRAAVDWIAHANDVDTALDWMTTSLGKHGGIATSNPALVYLRTGRTSIAFDHSTADWSSWKRRGIRYVACLVPLEFPAGSDYKVLYRSPGRLWVIEI
jgi:hypothetical protein